jgi:hypothetical protein
MSEPKLLRDVLLEAVNAWQNNIESRPIDPVVEAVWEKAKATIADHDRDFRIAHPARLSPGEQQSPGHPNTRRTTP